MILVMAIVRFRIIGIRIIENVATTTWFRPCGTRGSESIMLMKRMRMRMWGRCDHFTTGSRMMIMMIMMVVDIGSVTLTVKGTNHG